MSLLVKELNIKIAQLESALASERAKRVEAEALAERWKAVDAVTVKELLAAEVTIEQVREWRDDGDKYDANFYELGEIIDPLNTSALARHDAEVSAKALEEAAVKLRGIFERLTAEEWLRARAAELRTTEDNDQEVSDG